MAKWDFKIVGASFVKELVPIADDVQPRSQSFMQPSFHLEGGKIVMKESGQYVTAIYFPQIGEIDGVAPTDIDDAYAKLLTLVENFNGGGGTPQNLAQVLAIDNKTNDIPIVSNNALALVYVNDDYTRLSYESQAFTISNASVQLYSGVPVAFDSTISTDFTTPILRYNNEEVATQPWVTSQGYGTGTVTSVTGVDGETTVATGTTTPVIGISSTYTSARDAYADAKVANDLTSSTTVAPSKTAVLTEYDMITGLTFSGVFGLDKKGGRSYLPYAQTGSLTLSIGGSPIVGGFAVLRFTANGSAISGYSGWKLLSSDAITATNGVVHRVIVYQYEDEIWYSVKLN